MINYINIKNHKALKHAQMLGLGNINVILGKNNSGKTTILEALNKPDCYSIGRKIDDVEWLVSLFKGQADGYTNPPPNLSIDWFRNYILGLSQNDEIWYTENKTDIINKIKSAQKSNSTLGNFGADIFNHELIIDKFFQKSKDYFSTVLIPPKRQIEFISEIKLSQETTSTGAGIINRLFLLKNQDLESVNYKIYQKIYNIFTEITGARFNIIPNENNQIELVYNADKNWISASDSGLGLSDILVIISLINLSNYNVILLEEPENHLHAGYQKKLLNYFRSIKNKQFFISTHSSIFLDPLLVDKIFYCSNDGEITLSDQTSKSEIISSLGYSVAENLVADVLVLVEGPTDIPIYQEMFNWLGIDSKYNVKFWSLGGDIMASLDLSVFAERNNVFAIIDSDKGSHVQRTRFKENCEKYGIKCLKLSRNSIENYFPLNAIKEVFPGQISDEIINLSPTKSVDKQIGFYDKNRTIKIKNAEIVKNMNIDDIRESDLFYFIQEIKELLDKETNNSAVQIL